MDKVPPQRRHRMDLFFVIMLHAECETHKCLKKNIYRETTLHKDATHIYTTTLYCNNNNNMHYNIRIKMNIYKRVVRQTRW